MAIDLHQHTVDATLAAVGSKATWGGAFMTGVGWLLSSQGAALVGICGVVVGLAMNYHFSLRRDRREREAHEADMRRRDGAGHG